MSMPDFGELSSIRVEETSQIEDEPEPQPRKPYLVARRLSKEENIVLAAPPVNPVIAETIQDQQEIMDVESNNASNLNSEEPLSVQEVSNINRPGEGVNQENGTSAQEEFETVDLEERAGMEFEENAQRFEEDEDEEENDVIEKTNGAENEQPDVEILEEDGGGNEKAVHLPLSKIRKIMKTDEQVGIINKEAVAATAILAEHFISLVAQQSYKLAAASKKKTISLNHVKSALTSSAMFDFLEGCLPQLDN